MPVRRGRPPIPLPIPPDELAPLLASATLSANAVRFGVSIATMRCWRLHLGLPPYRHRGAAYREVLALLRAHPLGLSGALIAQQRGVSKQTTQELLSTLRARGEVCKLGGRRFARWVLAAQDAPAMAVEIVDSDTWYSRRAHGALRLDDRR